MGIGRLLGGVQGVGRPEGYRKHQGYWGLLGSAGGVGSCQGVSGGVKSVRSVLGAGRDCRYSGARRGIGGIRGIGGS